MPISAGFQTDNLGAISMYQRQSTVTRQVNGVAVDSVGNVFYANAATVGVSLIKRAGLLWTVDGAICVTTTDPGNTRQVNGFKVSAAGEMFVTTTAPAPTSQVTFDPILGYLSVSNSGAVHVAPYPSLDANLAALYLPGVGQTVSGGVCSAWADQSGNGATLSAAGSARPTSNSDGSLTGNGVANQMKTAAFGAALTEPFVITVLVRVDSLIAQEVIFDRITGPNNSALYLGAANSPEFTMFSTADGPFTTGVTVGAYNVIQCVFNGASSTCQTNNTTARTGNAGTNTLNGLSLFATGVGTLFSNCTIKGIQVRSASNATVNANDRNFWMRVGNL